MRLLVRQKALLSFSESRLSDIHRNNSSGKSSSSISEVLASRLGDCDKVVIRLQLLPKVKCAFGSCSCDAVEPMCDFRVRTKLAEFYGATAFTYAVASKLLYRTLVHAGFGLLVPCRA